MTRFILLAIILLGLSDFLYAQHNSLSDSEMTWTYTYIKAQEGQKQNLKKFIERNWFVMDSIAVLQGLFYDYKIISNNSNPESVKWDFIVAVEYFTKGTYADVAAEWDIIRSNHNTELVDNRNFPDLGKVIDSQQLIFEKEDEICTDPQTEILTPYLGIWNEYTASEEVTAFGRLEIILDPFGCALRKEFKLFSGAFSYSTLGYFDQEQNAWIETFSNGSKFKWVREGTEVLMINLDKSGQSQHRNRWTQPVEGTFMILEERSSDSGKTWEVKSKTRVQKIG
ncbi:MAG: hypothetical protein HRT61_08885 [Ekhidna sp.]|nr:hypothetical protein [Ekhidna sp.]